MGSIFSDITIIIVVAAGVAILFRSFKQPLVLAYIVSGILLGPFAFYQIHDSEGLRSFAQLGITLVLFMLGLELKLKELRSIGPIALVAGISQVILTFVLGFGIAQLLGFSINESTYLGIALTFSSTIVIVKLLSDKKDLLSLYGKISVGMLLVQDFFAVLALVMLSAFKTNAVISPISFLLVIFKGMIIVLWIYAMSKTVLPFLLRLSNKSSEVLFLFSLAWVLSTAALVSSPFFGFSIEMGGFLSGIALANFTENFQIIGKVRSLRDFSITIFFVLLGIEMKFTDISDVFLPVVVLSLFVLIVKPYVSALIVGFLGYKKRTSFLVGLNLGQISEFSLIVVFLGNSLGHVSDKIVSIVTLLGIIGFAASSTLIQSGNKLFKKLEPFIFLFERESSKREEKGDVGQLDDHIVVIGGHQMGQSILHALRGDGEKVIVIDFDPDIVSKLKKNDIPHLFGDIVDMDIQEKAQLEKARLVISTIPDIEDNLLLIKKMNKDNRRALIIVVAYEKEDAKELYKAGADYVVMPHLAGGMHLAKIIKERNLDHLDRYKNKDFMELL